MFWGGDRWETGLCVLLLLSSVGCASKAGQPSAGRGLAPTVAVATASIRDVPVEIRAIGNGEPYLTVAVRARVSGQLQKVYFKQGADVSEGDLLFLIDPRPYEDQVAQAKATLARDMAAQQQSEAAAARDRSTAENARAEAARYTDLFNQGIVSSEQYDQFRTGAQAADNAVKADEANIAAARDAVQVDQASLANAELQLSYTQIRAPITGRTGSLNVQIGNMVKDQDTTPMVVINEISPLYVSFSVPERFLPQIRQYSATGKLTVTAMPPQGDTPESGVLDFIDNTVDTATGTIRVKGVFENSTRRLWPGQFLNVVLTLTVDRGAVVVPTAAVQAGQNGQYVFVVDRNLVARERSVETGPVIGNDTVIVKGVAAGERVVTDGQLAVIPGAKVQLLAQQSAVSVPSLP